MAASRDLLLGPLALLDRDVAPFYDKRRSGFQWSGHRLPEATVDATGPTSMQVPSTCAEGAAVASEVGFLHVHVRDQVAGELGHVNTLSKGFRGSPAFGTSSTCPQEIQELVKSKGFQLSGPKPHLQLHLTLNFLTVH